MKTIKRNNKLLIVAVFLSIAITSIYTQQGWQNLNTSFGGGDIYFKNTIAAGSKYYFAACR